MNAHRFLDRLVAQGARAGRWAALVASAATLAGCGAGSVSTTPNPVTTGPAAPAAYAGPAPSSADVQAFMVNLWMNIHDTNHCGACHIQGVQSPSFARNDDINLAYQAANTVVDLSNPSASIMVNKVGGGHHCWLADNQACADQLTTWIQNWAGVTLGATATTVKLTAPPPMSAGGSKQFPADPSLFQTNVYPLLTKYCSRCHQANALTPQSPYFASPDITVAYPAAQPKINLNNPAQSRFVQRLGTDFHNCWSVCAQNAATMQAAIQTMANGIAVTNVDPALVISKALTMFDGTIASSAGRYEASIIAKYEFKTGVGTTAYDTSGVEPSLDLTFTGDITWVGGWGVSIQNGGKLQGTSFASSKLYNLIQSTGEYSIEAWVAPSDAADKMAYITAYAGGAKAGNFSLEQDVGNYGFLGQNSNTDQNGAPALETPTANMVLQPTLQHVVATYDPINGRQIYVNGVLVANGDPQKGGDLSAWDNTFALVLGNDPSSMHPFTGEIRLVAIYDRALTPAQVTMNFNANVGQRYYLLFDVSSLVGTAQSYVMFTVSQYDSTAYLFQKPTFIMLDPTAQAPTFSLSGMRIGENGQQVGVGQAYIPLNVTVSNSGYSASSGFPLTRVGTTVPLQNGPASDVFFLSFDKIGTFTHVQTDPVPVASAPVVLPAPTVSDIGVKSYERLSATMAAVTQVSRGTAAVSSLFQNLEQSLPASTDFQSFISSNQVAIAQLAMQYCNSLVTDTQLSNSYFGNVDFTQPVTTVFTPAGSNAFINSLMNNVLGTQALATNPNLANVSTELNNLITKLTACGGSCAAGRSATVAEATCAALVGSAATLVE
jgi:hypothetical protein